MLARPIELVGSNTHEIDRETRKVLVVVGDRTTRMSIEQQLKGLDHETVAVGDANSARDLLAANPQAADVILLDASVEGTDRLQFVRLVRHDAVLGYRPVVMLSDNAGAQQVSDSLDRDVFCHLAKPADPVILKSVVASALRYSGAMKRLHRQIEVGRSAMSLVGTAKWQFRTPHQANHLAALLASAFPSPERVAVGIVELMLNAIEHGNLGIGFERKLELIEANGFEEEVERRLNLPEYQKRVGTVALKRKENGLYVVITDEGAGFRPQSFLRLDPGRCASRCGRGIAQARAVSFDRLGYNDVGNQVVGFVSAEESLEW